MLALAPGDGSAQYELQWDCLDRLDTLLLPNNGNARYRYDATGQRSRKLVSNASRTIKERTYMGAFEVYREFDRNGSVSLERESLHIHADGQRVALVETKTVDSPSDGSPGLLLRYQYQDHLGSAAIELDQNGKTISHEEYYPYGTTSYQAVDKELKAAAKRYRYTGMERDEESGLAYHSARYYMPWLCRWTRPDPIGIKGGKNLYSYVSNNPIGKSDSTGTEEIEIFHRTTSTAADNIVQNGVQTHMSGQGSWAGRGFYAGDSPNIPDEAIRRANRSPASLDTVVSVTVDSSDVTTITDEGFIAAQQSDEVGRMARNQNSYDPNVVDTNRGHGGEPVKLRDRMTQRVDQLAQGKPVVRWQNPDGSYTYVVRDSSAVKSRGVAGRIRRGRFSANRGPRTRTRTPRTGKAPRGKGILLSLIIAGGVLLYTGDSHAAAQSLNPAAGTTDALAEGASNKEVAGAAATDLVYLIPVWQLQVVLIGAALNRAAMDASHFPTPEGWVDEQVSAGRNPFCALCHTTRNWERVNIYTGRTPSEESMFQLMEQSNSILNDRALLESWMRNNSE
ncbi:MAG: RHS repeat-associated core domain-containing protein [Bacteroidota bacterium]